MSEVTLEELIKKTLPESDLTDEEKAILLLADKIVRLKNTCFEYNERRKECIAQYERLRKKYQNLETKVSDLTVELNRLKQIPPGPMSSSK